ncbi:MAG: tyrosine-type recombinase/integrase [Bacteroidota bacterium]
MNITYSLQGRKEVKRLLVRMRYSHLDISCSTNIMLKDSQWDLENQSVIDNPEVNISLQQLKTDLLKAYNKDFSTGKIIDKFWIASTLKSSFNRPKEESKLVNPSYTIYFTDFSLWWLENHADDWNVSSKKKMGLPLQNQYKKFVSIVSEYETVISERLQLRNILISDLKSFADYLETEFYQVSTIERHVGRFRFFLNRALEHNIEVSNSFKQRIYFDKDDDVEGVYLNESEIQKIVEHDFSDNYELDITKQNFLIGVYTGLRAGDFLNLDTSNMSDGVFKIKTQKTGSRVVIPIHPEAKKVIDSNFGNLPPKISKTDFNIHIKTICQICEIDNQVYGKLFDKKRKRKVFGYYKKYQLISSHVCRKSFASLYYGKVDDSVLKSIMGWSKNSNMLQHYNKVSKQEYAEILHKQFNQ